MAMVLLGGAAFLAILVFGYRGFIEDRPDSAARFRDRFWFVLALLATSGCGLIVAVGRGDIAWEVANGIALLCDGWLLSESWARWEWARQSERAERER